MFGKGKKEIVSIGEGELIFSNRFLIKLLYPLFIEQLLVFAVALINSMMVARVGEAAVSAVSLVDSVMMLIITLMTAMATGGAVVVGQYLGQGKKDRARAAGDQLLLFLLLLSLAMIAVMYLFKNFLLALIFGDIEDDVMAYCNTYYIIVVASVPFIAVYNSGTALFRSIGNSKVTMKISFLMIVINVTGNAVMIFGMKCGVEGVALPTLISRIVAAVIVVHCLKNPEVEVHISKKFVYRPDRQMIKKILRIGVPNGIENSMFQLGKILLLSMISGFGTAAIAANAVGNAVAMMAVLPGMAVGYTVIPVISRCVGSGDYRQVRFYTKKLLKWAYGLMFIVNVMIVVLTPLILDIYALSPGTAALTGKIIIFHSVCAIVIWPASFTIPNMLRAASDVMYTMIVATGSMWIFRICCGILLGKIMGMGVFGVWVAMIVDWIVRSICFIIRYRNEKWRHPAVR